MAVNKITMNTPEGEQTLIDLTGDSVTPKTLAEGAIAHNAAGEQIVGEMPTTAVLYTEQTLTEAQQELARQNIDAVSPEELEKAKLLVVPILFDDTSQFYTPVSYSDIIDALNEERMVCALINDMLVAPVSSVQNQGVYFQAAYESMLYWFCVNHDNSISFGSIVAADVEAVNALSIDKLDASALPQAINTALAQAKASGEFDGKDAPAESILFIPQTLTENEQQVARKNIGAVTVSEVSSYVDDAIAAIPTPDVSGQISEHNVATAAHNDIRLLITELTNRLNALANSDDTTLDQMSEVVAYIKANRGLIEEVTTKKVNVADIINNLTTNVGNKPLSAAQGVALKGLIDALSASLANYQPKGDYALSSAIPTKVSQLTNDKDYLVKSEVLSDGNGKLKEDVLPEGYPYISYGEVLPETVIVIDETGQGNIENEFYLQIGHQYTVKYNGVEYVCEAKSAKLSNIKFILLGNSAVFPSDEPAEESDEPFAVVGFPVELAAPGSYGGIFALDGSEEVIISISGSVIKKMNKELLPSLGLSNLVDGVVGSVHNIMSTALNAGAFAVGAMTTAYGYASMAEGDSNGKSAVDFITENSTAEEIIEAYSENSGFTLAFGDGSHAEGMTTLALGEASHAEGRLTKAVGNNAHSEGWLSEAYGESSHAEGSSSKALGQISHAEGAGTDAVGNYSHSEGHNTTAKGESSHAEGTSTEAVGDSQHVQGRYNISSDKYAHIVGNGTSYNGHSNAHTLDWGGNAWFAGDVYVGSTSGTNEDDGSKKLATEEYVNNNIPTNLSDLTNDAGYYNKDNPSVVIQDTAPSDTSVIWIDPNDNYTGEFSDAVELALATAKASGEFDGADGKDGTSITIQNISESTADGGTNTVTFSDGKNINIKNGSKGSSGTTPVKGTHYWTEEDKSEMVSDVISSIGSDSLISSEDREKLNNTNIAYGICSTAADVAAKIVVLDGNTNWSLAKGSTVMVKFDNTNTAESVTINVNGTGAYPIWYNASEYTSDGTAYTGYAGRTIVYMFNGTHYVWVSSSYDANSTYTNASLGQGYATCSTAAATTAKTASLSSYKLTTGGIVSVKFTYDVPANATLAINSTTAKAMYFRGAKITGDVIKAGDIATFVYSSYYYLISIDRWQNDISTMQNQLTQLTSAEYKTSLINEVIAALPVYNGEIV